MSEFSWYNIPKRGKIYQKTIKSTNVKKRMSVIIDQIAMKYKTYSTARHFKI
jgi:hypothetical protein